MSGTAVLWICIVVVFVGGAALAYRAGAGHKAKVVAYARQRGMGLVLRDDTYANLPWGEPFGLGTARSALFLLTGEIDTHPFRCFEYHFTANQAGGAGGRTFYCVYSVQGPSALPDLTVHKRKTGAKVAGAVGFDGIQLESEKFNSTYVVLAEDRKFASDLLTPQLMEWLLSVDAPGFSVHGADFVVIERGVLIGQKVDRRVAELGGVLDRVPNFLWDRGS